MMNLHGLLLSLFLHGALAFAVGSHLMGEDLPPSPPHAIEVVFEKAKPSLSQVPTPSHEVIAKKPLDPTGKPSSRGLTTGSKTTIRLSSLRGRGSTFLTESAMDSRLRGNDTDCVKAKGLDTAIKELDEEKESCSKPFMHSCTPTLQHASHEGLSNPLPSYPVVARKRGHEGSVTLQLRISKDGSCDGAQIKISSGSSYLDEAASAAVRSWRFTPALLGTAPATDAIEVTFDFRLSGVEMR